MCGSIPIARLVMSAVAHWQDVFYDVNVLSVSVCYAHNAWHNHGDAKCQQSVSSHCHYLRFEFRFIRTFIMRFSYSVRFRFLWNYVLISLKHNSDSTLPLSIHSILSTYSTFHFWIPPSPKIFSNLTDHLQLILSSLPSHLTTSPSNRASLTKLWLFPPRMISVVAVLSPSIDLPSSDDSAHGIVASTTYALRRSRNMETKATPFTSVFLLFRYRSPFYHQYLSWKSSVYCSLRTFSLCLRGLARQVTQENGALCCRILCPSNSKITHGDKLLWP